MNCLSISLLIPLSLADILQGGDVCHWNSAGVRRDTVGVTEPFSQVNSSLLLVKSRKVKENLVLIGGIIMIP